MDQINPVHPESSRTFLLLAFKVQRLKRKFYIVTHQKRWMENKAGDVVSQVQVVDDRVGSISLFDPQQPEYFDIDQNSNDQSQSSSGECNISLVGLK